MPNRKSRQTESDFSKDLQVMSLFIDSAKTYVQLSSGGLLLSITFLREILNVPKENPIPLDPILISAWAALLLAIVAGAVYQLLAVKYLEINYLEEPKGSEEGRWTTQLVNNPGIIYNLMLLLFGVGALLLTITALHRSAAATPSRLIDPQVLCPPQPARAVPSRSEFPA